VEYRNARFGRGLEQIMKTLYDVQNYWDSNRPWELIKQNSDPINNERLRNVQYIVLESLRISGILLQPIVPWTATRLLDRLGVSSLERSVDALEFGRKAPVKLSTDETVFFSRLRE
jgi:methionyl-tRNA synthetase